ncbi:SSI family serine proteinase inhibitor [Streptomyces tateyamensis]|uniref:SSI family serine proteinase inhibitor n=1 Tax=Streptomyces tateyamensis TaxID=565073 RepID=UPI0015E89AC1|nr:SSI family serine proteinase inhibitor [Streptomyces tateyamensis]
MISLRIRAALYAVALALLSVPTPAQAAPAVSESVLTLTVTDDGSSTPLGGTELLCQPAGGSHPQAAAACAALEAAGGDPERLAGRTGIFCNQLFQPVTARAAGLWRGVPVHWQRSFSNLCGLHTRTDPLFRV